MSVKVVPTSGAPLFCPFKSVVLRFDWIKKGSHHLTSDSSPDVSRLSSAFQNFSPEIVFANVGWLNFWGNGVF